MSQYKIYGHRTNINRNRQTISDVIHAAAVEGFGLPSDKRFHRFMSLNAEDFIAPADRTENYLIIEVHLFERRSGESKKAFFQLLLSGFKNVLQIDAIDIEVTLIETPRHDWLIRGLPGDELTLNYKVGDEATT